MTDDYRVPIHKLSAMPVEMMMQLVAAAGVKRCAAPGCEVRWIGGHGLRRYCSPECAAKVRRTREGDA
jgi:hypothetical protein